MLRNRFTGRVVAALTALFIGTAGAVATVAPAEAFGSQSRVGNPTGPGVAATAPIPAGTKMTEPSRRTGQSVTAASLPALVGTGRMGTTAACDTRVKGSFGYQDENNAWRYSPNIQVQVWDADPTTGDDMLAIAVTNQFGAYDICFDAASETAPDIGTADIYVRFVTEVMQWRVGHDGGPYLLQTAITNDIVPGTMLNLGDLTTGDPNLHRMLHAYDIANRAWWWIPKPVNGCWDQKDGACRQLQIRWTADSTDGPYYSPDTNTVRLAANDPNIAMVVMREIASAVMDDVYNDAMPPTPDCMPHPVTVTTSTGCAWARGWAHWFATTVLNDPLVRLPGGVSFDLEGQRWGNGWGETDTAELRVAGALLDIADAGNETLWDRSGEGSQNVWFTFTHHVSNTFAEFWAHRAADGFNVADTGALACLYQNTIDYQFRDPLANYSTLTRPRALLPHNFQYQTANPYWSAIALRPVAGTDHDLYLYDDRAQSTLLGASFFSSSTVDIIAVDTNLRLAGDYYPQVRLWNGTADYQVQLAQGTEVLQAGSANATMNASSIVQVWDTFLTAGVPVTLRVTPSNSSQNPELFLFGSDLANPSTFVRSRSNAVAASTAGGPGAAETFTYTPLRSGWYGVVVINAAGAGNYTVTRA